jgi:large subunit ribosomal protein L10
MSKPVKQMQIDALKRTFGDVRDLVVLSVQGLDATTDNALRLGLRKKKIRMQVVKNSLCQRAFDEIGMKISGYWNGPTTLAWGGSGIAELSRTIAREVQDLIKKNPKLKELLQIKGAVSEGQQISFERAREMPTREEAIATILGMILGPASQIAGQIIGPAAQIAGQIQTISEKKPEEAAAPAA